MFFYILDFGQIQTSTLISNEISRIRIYIPPPIQKFSENFSELLGEGFPLGMYALLKSLVSLV